MRLRSILKVLNTGGIQQEINNADMPDAVVVDVFRGYWAAVYDQFAERIVS